MDLIAIRPLPKFLAEKASNEKNENPLRIASDLQSLQDWVNKQPHLTARGDEQFLVGFLRGCKHSLERCKEKINSHYTLRTAYPEFFANRDPTSPEFIELFSKGMACPLPIPHPKGPRLFLFRLGVYDVERHGFVGYMRFLLMVIDRNFVEDDYVAVCGFCVLLDMEGFTMKYFAQLSVPLLKKVADMLKRYYPVPHSEIHVINLPASVDVIVPVIKTFIPAKTSERLHFHANLDSVYDYIPKRCLPAEYGGEVGALSEITSNFMERYLSDTKWFIEDSKYRSDESKRSGKAQTVENLFGMDGSFRKLEID